MIKQLHQSIYRCLVGLHADEGAPATIPPCEMELVEGSGEEGDYPCVVLLLTRSAYSAYRVSLHDGWARLKRITLPNVWVSSSVSDSREISKLTLVRSEQDLMWKLCDVPVDEARTWSGHTVEGDFFSRIIASDSESIPMMAALLKPLLIETAIDERGIERFLIMTPNSVNEHMMKEVTAQGMERCLPKANNREHVLKLSKEVRCIPYEESDDLDNRFFALLRREGALPVKEAADFWIIDKNGFGDKATFGEDRFILTSRNQSSEPIKPERTYSIGVVGVDDDTELPHGYFRFQNENALHAEATIMRGLLHDKLTWASLAGVQDKVNEQRDRLRVLSIEINGNEKILKHGNRLLTTLVGSA